MSKSTLPKLPKSFKDKWVKALTSGEYEQATGELVSPDGGYCCLGVAGKVCGLEDEDMVHEGNIVWEHVEKANDGGNGNRADVLGLTMLYTNEQLQDKLANFNDDAGWSFKRIAGYVQRYM